MKLKSTTIVNMVALFFLFTVSFVLPSNILGQKEVDQPDSELAREANYTIDKARKIALRQFPGNVESEKLVKENGKLFYSFEIRDSYSILVDVKVDAISGKIESSEMEKRLAKSVTNMASDIKNGTITGIKKFGQGVNFAAKKVVGIF